MTRLPDPTRSVALLVGVSRYSARGLRDLPAVANNLAALRTALTSDAYGTAFTADRCTILENVESPAELHRAIRRAGTSARDTLLVYYAGHGLTGGKSDALSLACADTRRDELSVSALPYAAIRELFLESRADNKILILDCCFSGRAIRDTMGEPLLTGRVEISGTMVIASSGTYETSLAPRGHRYTAFTGALLRVLREGIASAPDPLPVGLMFAKVGELLAASGLPLPSRSATRTVEQLALVANRAVEGTPDPAVRLRRLRPPGRWRRALIPGVAVTLALAVGADNARGTAQLDPAPAPGSACASVVGDWDGDGVDTVGLVCRQPSAALFTGRVVRDRAGQRIVSGGLRVPLPALDLCNGVTAGDWDGDGIDSLALVCRRSDEAIEWRLLTAQGWEEHRFSYGNRPTCYPVAGDWNGDGKDTVGIVCPGGGPGMPMEWKLMAVHEEGTDNVLEGRKPIYFASNAQCRPIVGDWDRSGRDGIGSACADGNTIVWQLRGVGSSRIVRQEQWHRPTGCSVPFAGVWSKGAAASPGLACRLDGQPQISWLLSENDPLLYGDAGTAWRLGSWARPPWPNKW